MQLLCRGNAVKSCLEMLKQKCTETMVGNLLFLVKVEPPYEHRLKLFPHSTDVVDLSSYRERLSQLFTLAAHSKIK